MGALGFLEGMAYGADYNPEQWGPATWKEDLELMGEAGVNLVSLAIFSWARLEPRPGDYEFGWLDEVMDGLAGAGIGANLANATASPPPWFSHRYPETLPMQRDGTRLWTGSRQAYCPSSPIFREHAARLTEAVAGRYREHPALTMWHVSNEIGCHNALCFCDVSAEAFRAWLRSRYGSLDRLNEAWGTAFWSQRYGAWEEILPPRQAPSFRNPTQEVDFHRFSSDESLAVYLAQRDVLRAITPDVLITTNLMVTKFQRDLDYWSWAEHLDVLANDHYLDAADPDAHLELAFAADLTRGLAGGGPWMVMEHSTSAVNWQPRNVAKRPGEMLRNSLQHVARGSDAVMFFQWRASKAGAEKYHSAMVPHAGTGTKIWNEVVRLGEMLNRLGEVAGTRVMAEVALLFDWQSWWALETDAHPSIDVTYLDRPHAFHRALWRAGVTVDLVAPGASLDRYQLLIVPSLYIAGAETARQIEQFVAAGGTAIVTYMSGIVDEDLHITPGGFPPAFRRWLGITVEEFFPLRAGDRVALDDGTSADVWCELLHLTGAEAVASYADGPLAGTPAVTVHRHGEGTVWYTGTRLGPAGLQRLVSTALTTAGVQPTVPMVTAPAGLEATRRVGDRASYLFLINHGSDAAHVRATGYDLVADREVTGTASVTAGGVAVIRQTNP